MHLTSVWFLCSSIILMLSNEKYVHFQINARYIVFIRLIKAHTNKWKFMQCACTYIPHTQIIGIAIKITVCYFYLLSEQKHDNQQGKRMNTHKTCKTSKLWMLIQYRECWSATVCVWVCVCVLYFSNMTKDQGNRLCKNEINANEPPANQSESENRWNCQWH